MLFAVEGVRYLLNPFHDPTARGPHRATVRQLGRKFGEPELWWEISAPLITGARNKFASLRVTFTFEFPDPAKRAEAERLVDAMLAQGVLMEVVPLIAHGF